MKKAILFASVCAICACLSTPAGADGTCDGGELIKGLQNEHTYCLSSTDMTWLEAFQWCQEQGRHLATLQEACVDWDGTTGENGCANLALGTGAWVWTANPSVSSYAYFVNLSSGGIYTYYSRYHIQALCF